MVPTPPVFRRDDPGGGSRASELSDAGGDDRHTESVSLFVVAAVVRAKP
jgi:hypothetical protein